MAAPDNLSQRQFPPGLTAEKGWAVANQRAVEEEYDRQFEHAEEYPVKQPWQGRVFKG